MEIAAPQPVRLSARGRPHTPADCCVFFVAVPGALAFLFSLVGIRLIAGMPWLDGLLYMSCHMYLSWWSVSIGAWTARSLLQRWHPAAWFVVVAGFLLVLGPSAWLFQLLGDRFAEAYPAFASNRVERVAPSANPLYLLHFARYSLPALLLFAGGVYGYRYVTGVDWLGWSAEAERPGSPKAAAGARRPDPRAGRIEGTTLDADATVIAAKAEQHYVRLWTDRGTDLVRYRFRDVVDGFAESRGAQVHRSWWVNFERVRNWRRTGRTLELLTDGDLSVPVSESYRRMVLDVLSGEQEPH